MAKLIPLEEAAKRLGISAEELTDMRSRNEVFGYRDGASWKFKPEELERVASDLGLGAKVADMADDMKGLVSKSGESDLIDVDADMLNLDDDSSDDNDSILVTEEELGRSDESTSSTIIGKAGLEIPASESDIKLADESASSLSGESDIDLALEGGSDLSLAGDSDLSLATDGDSDLSIDKDDLGLDSSASDVLSGDSDLLSLDDGGTGALADGSGIDLSLDDEGDGSGGSSLKLAGSDISLDDELKLEGDSDESGIGALDSSIDLDLDDDDLGSGMGSDVTLGASDSGINLNNPSDSGISLEDVPSDLGSGIDSSLELGDEIELEMDAADPEDATDLQADEEFLLTPVASEGELDEESDDSGSQVIALDSDEFDESEATMLVEDNPLVADDEGFGGVGGLTGAAVGTAAAGAVATVTPTVEEADFTVWNIVGLSMLALFMAVCGILALDVIQNIWSWDQPYSLNSTIMDFFVN